MWEHSLRGVGSTHEGLILCRVVGWWRGSSYLQSGRIAEGLILPPEPHAIKPFKKIVIFGMGLV